MVNTKLKFIIDKHKIQSRELNGLFIGMNHHFESEVVEEAKAHDCQLDDHRVQLKIESLLDCLHHFDLKQVQIFTFVSFFLLFF